MSWIRGQTIGIGSSAIVSAAISRHSGETFAVKSAELSNSEFLQREQKILSTLNCSRIVEYRGCDVTWEDNRVVFNLMIEHMPGGTIVDLARNRGGRLDEFLIGRYTWQIVQGLVYLHSNGIVHCDIKGRNILLGNSGAKIADFGCSKRLNPAAGACSIGGTPQFMAPEVAQGKEQGFPADIWSLGCTIIEIASGSAPWPNVTNPATLLYKIAFSGELPAIPEFLSDEAKDFLGKCLRQDQKERWKAQQLLEHPFLVQFGTSTKQNQEFDTISPTSVLDQGIWSSSMEEPEVVQTVNSFDSPMQRVRQLCSNHETVSDWDDTFWITVRRKAEDGITDFSSQQIFLLLGGSVSCCNSNINSSILGQKFVGNGQHQKERVVNQLPLFYIYFLLSFHFIYIKQKKKKKKLLYPNSNLPSLTKHSIIRDSDLLLSITKLTLLDCKIRFFENRYLLISNWYLIRLSCILIYC